jgi:hypothetical protein
MAFAGGALSDRVFTSKLVAEYTEIKLIRDILLRELERMAAADAGTHPEIWFWFKRQADLSVDPAGGTSVRIDLTGGGISAHWIMDVGRGGMANLEERVTHVARQNLSLVAQMHWARLNALFPKSIKNVGLERNEATLEHRLVVHFKNGHVAECIEKEAKDDLFTARCAMLYNLPPI